jgi:hypothetical protein
MRHVIVLSLLLTGCAWSDGEGFATVEPSASARYERLADRQQPEGWEQLSSSFQIQLTRAQLTVPRIELQGGAQAGGGGGSFDPANPPPGYTLCHNGHCDREDGALVPYDEVAAELAGGGSAPRTLVSLPLGTVDLLQAAQPVVPACEPSCDLPRTELQRARWTLGALRLEGRVRDGLAAARLPGAPTFLLALEGEDSGLAALSTALDLPSDRTEPPRISMALELALSARLFDGIDWSSAKVQGDHIDLQAPGNEALRAQLLENLSAVAPTARVERTER